MGAIAGAPPTLDNTARSILAGLGNDSPSAGQLTAMEAWITAEGSFGGSGPYSNNPLNVTVGNVKTSMASGFLPATFQFGVPDPKQNGGNPVVQFPDLTSGIIATIAGLKQPFAAGITKLLSKPQDVSTPALSGAVTAAGWGTQPFGGVTPNPGQSGGSGGSIGVGAGGTTASGNGPTGTTGQCTPPTSATDVGGAVQYALCTLRNDFIRGSAYAIGAVLVIVGVWIVLADKDVPGHEQAEAVKKKAATAAKTAATAAAA